MGSVSAGSARCARCGRPVEPGQFLCASCREEAPAQVATKESPREEPRPRPPTELQERASRWPPGMPRPSPVQYHATVMVAIFLVLLGLALFAFWNHHGVGPFRGSVRDFRAPPGRSLVVVATVENQGSKSARATCRLSALDASNTEEAGEMVLTPTIPGHETITLRHTFPSVTAAPAAVTISCS